MKIRILFGRLEAFAILRDTLTARVIWKALPIEGAVKKWGEEIYFPIEVDIREESDALTDVNAGDLGHWPPGRDVCIFFGRTPATSHGDQPVAASPANIFGHVNGNAKFLRPLLKVI